MGGFPLFWGVKEMRMWMVNPRDMCRKHLMGEHVELHMLGGCLSKEKSIQGYVDTGLVETGSIYNRHSTLVKEIERRGYSHKSPLPVIDINPVGHVDIDKSIEDLSNRCNECSYKNNRVEGGSI